MKKIIFGTAVAAIAMLSACENIAPQEGTIPEPAPDKVVLTASLDAETKTYLQYAGNGVYKTCWAEDDGFIVWDMDVDYSTVEDADDYGGYFVIENGVGISAGQFVLDEGRLPDHYMAVYGDIWPVEGSNNVWLSYVYEDQCREVYETINGEVQGFDDWTYPMYAEGTLDYISFKNLLSVFKISVVGDGETLKKVSVSSLDEDAHLAGYIKMDFSKPRASFEFLEEEISGYEPEYYNEIKFNPGIYDNDQYQWIYPVLSDNPVECYIVIPPGTYPSGLKITLYTDKGEMSLLTDDNLSFQSSELREVPQITYTSTLSYDGTWRVVGYYSDEMSLFTQEDDYYVLKNYLYEGREPFYFMYGDSERYVIEGSNFTNIRARLVLSDHDSNYMPRYGYYDIYIDSDKNIYVLPSGLTPDDLPEVDAYVSQYYGDIRYDRLDGDLVKVHGTVLAKSTNGVILYINGGFIFVSQSDFEVGDVVDLYATKTTNRDLPELTDVIWSCLYANDGAYPGTPWNITNDFDYLYSWNFNSCDYISFLGTLYTQGDGYSIVVENSGVIGSIFNPIQDLSAYEGQKVLVEGFYVGHSEDDNGQRYLNVVLSEIKTPDVGGSTEDVIPDDDIVIPAR